jgi:hypothetical protein
MASLDFDEGKLDDRGRAKFDLRRNGNGGGSKAPVLPPPRKPTYLHSLHFKFSLLKSFHLLFFTSVSALTCFTCHPGRHDTSTSGSVWTRVAFTHIDIVYTRSVSGEPSTPGLA